MCFAPSGLHGCGFRLPRRRCGFLPWAGLFGPLRAITPHPRHHPSNPQSPIPLLLLHLQSREVHGEPLVLLDQLLHRQANAAVAGLAAEDRGQRAVDRATDRRIVVPPLDHLLVETGDVPLGVGFIEASTSLGDISSVRRECTTCPNSRLGRRPIRRGCRNRAPGRLATSGMP